MRLVVTRVTEAAVSSAGEEIARIGRGLLVLVGVARGDSSRESEALATKTAGLRIFPDGPKPLDRSILDVGGEVLVVSQFTLLADTSRGRRPSLGDAAPPEEAEVLYRRFVECLRARGVHVRTGRFGASMAVSSVNDGPVTLILQQPIGVKGRIAENVPGTDGPLPSGPLVERVDPAALRGDEQAAADAQGLGP
jgi:D-tyrosyl-tRNA(Tyr) deacylase